ncbi:chromosome partitioning protein ParA [Paenibacillus sp. Y412MC10]|uniref:chromosome partitioning protein ParA n=1 Tax=Geobacillus sp. (strain Y412MC10) TaxID=481743 RepID=UPI0011AB616F|nr:chromosome partitioning protein ParA [Paenibacillus sp. Y412MC10]
MAKITFWGPRHGQVGATSNLVSVAANIAMNHPIKTMISHTHWSRSTLELTFRKPSTPRDMQFAFTDFGIDALERLAKSNRLTPDAIKNNTSPLIEGHLDLLYGTSKPDEYFHEQVAKALPSIFEAANNYYDLVMVDVNSGVRNQLTNTILQNSDLVVVCLNQNASLLDAFFSKEEYPQILDQKDHIIVLGNYDRRSKYSAKNIARKYGQRNVYTVPHCTSFMDAANANNVLEFFLRNRHVASDHENSFFLNEVKRLSRAITNIVGIDAARQEAGGA